MNYAQTIGTRVTGLPNNSTLYSVVTLTITTTGKPVQITTYGDVNNSSGAFNGQLAIYRDGSGTTAGSTYTAGTQLGNLVFYESSGSNENQAYCLAVLDTTVAAGTHTYTLVSYNRSGTGTFDFGEAQGPTISAIELASAQGPTGGLAAGDYVMTAKLSADQTILNATDTVLPWVSDFDPRSWLKNTGTNTARFQPTIAGYYSTSVGVWWAKGVLNNEQTNIQMRKNTGTYAILQNPIPTATNAGLSMAGSKLVYLNGSTDYVDVTVYTSNTTNQVVQYGGGSSGQGTWFSAHLLASGAGFTGPTGSPGSATNTGATGPTGTVLAQEVLAPVVAPTSTQAIDWRTGSVVYVTGMTTNWTPNLTNLPTTANRSYGVTFVLVQGSTPYILNGLQIAGSATTIKWGNASPPTGTANRTEIVSFTLLYTSAWTALASFASYG